MSGQQTPLRPSHEDPPESVVRVALARILASDVFSRSDRLSAFLRFVVEQTLDGHGDTLKEQVLANELYGKGADFSTAADPIVRVDARRLRDKLREYYASNPHDPVVISVPKGSYTPFFEENGTGPGPALDVPGLETTALPSADVRGSPVGAPVTRRWSRLWSVGAAIVLLGALGWLAIGWQGASSEPPPLRILTVTSFPGAEGMASLSPDGNFVAFTWTGPVFTDTADVWVKAVDGDALRRLTDTPHFHEAFTSWSPDGRQIAFQRMESGSNRGVYLMSPLGGAERKVVDRGGNPSWTPDGRALVMVGRTPTGFAIFEHILQTGARRQLTRPARGFGDQSPKVSPDGATLAFARVSESLSQAAVFVVPMSGGEPTRLTEWSPTVGGLDWTPDGREILYPQTDTSGSRVFRIAAAGGGRATAVPGIPIGINMVSVSQPRQGRAFRLSLGYGQPDVGLRLVDLRSTTSAGVMATVTPFCDATRMDMPGRFSRDGTHVAFTSDRSGNWQVWVAGRSGAELRTVRGLEGGATVNVGSWSPDGRSVALDAIVGGHSAIYLLRVDSGQLTRLSGGRANESDPEWSGDGRWVYYASDVSGRSEIWKIRAEGGTPVQITTDGGFEPREAPDGRSLYYVDAPHQHGLVVGSTLKRISSDGGPVSVVVSGVPPGAWDVTDTGIVFVKGAPGPSPGPGAADGLNEYSFRDGRVRRLGDLPFLVSRFGVSRVLTVSRDGRWVLISHIDSWQRDILVADNVR
jgi:Tol biopolymer transport system component